MKLSIDRGVRDFHVSKTILESFIDTVFQEKRKQTSLVKIFLVVLGSSLITLSSYITIPLYPVPVTAQTLVILLIGLSYGSHLAFLTICC